MKFSRISIILLQGLLFASASTCFAASKPITIEEAFKAALQKNEMLQESKEQIIQSEAKIDQLVGGIFPNLGFNLSHQVLPEHPNAAFRDFSPAQQTVANFYVTQPIFKGLREFNGLSQLKHMRNSQQASHEQLINRLYQEVSANYLQILSYEQDLKNLEEQSDLYQKRVTELQARTERGESNETDVISAQSTQASLLAEIRMTEGQHKTTRETFHFLTGLERDASLVDPKLDLAKQLGYLDKYLARVEKRPDVKDAADKLEGASKGVSVAWGSHFPSIDATGNYYLTRPGFLSELKWDVGVKITIPIFEGGATQAKVTEAVSKRKEAEIELERTRRAAIQEIRSIHNKLKARMDYMWSLKKSAELSRKNSTLMQRNYRRGLSRNIDVQMALTEFRVAQRSFDQAYFSAQQEIYQLQVAAALVNATSENP